MKVTRPLVCPGYSEHMRCLVCTDVASLRACSSARKGNMQVRAFHTPLEGGQSLNPCKVPSVTSLYSVDGVQVFELSRGVYLQ